MAVESASNSASGPDAGTGLGGLDAVLDGLRLGDNVVWRIDGLADYRRFAGAFAACARAAGRRVVYVRFSERPPVLEAAAADAVCSLDALAGFEPFTVRLHTLIEREGRRVFYVFDCLSDLLGAWATDGMIANFFRVTCPYLYELDTVAYFALERRAHSHATMDAIRATTQVLIDLYNDAGTLYLHPLKVWQRKAATMFLPHRAEDGRFIPITVSCEATSLFQRLAGSGVDDARRLDFRLDFWERLFIRAAELVASSSEQDERQAMVEQICRLVIGRDERILALARRHLALEDLLAIKARLIGTGFIGGKAVGMLLGRSILERDPSARWGEVLEPHDSYFIGSDLFHAYIVHNGWWSLFMWQRSEAGYLEGAARLRERFATGSFPDDILHEFRLMLEHFGQYPIIVRSSSLLEDGFGNAFAGKYDSFFCANQGSPEERLASFVDALKRVYASTLAEEALEYRMLRGLARQEEQMAVLVQRVSGAYHGDRYFFPAFSGVGISYNTYVWRHDIDPRAGMLRMVIGLGTRAVDRVDRDYPRIVSLDQPALVPLASEDRRRFSQHDVDVLDIEKNCWRTVPLAELSPRPTLPMHLFAVREGGVWTVTFDRLLAQTDFAPTLRALMQSIERAYEYPVDVEFTGTYDDDGRLRINLIQCRPLQTRGLRAKRVAIGAADGGQTLFRATGSFMGGSVALPIRRVVAIDPAAFVSLPLSDKYELARLVGRINRSLVAKDRVPTLLMGPGRWGTSTPTLGVPVRFAEINAFTAIAELAFSAGGLQPDLSFGSHFFQDLVEAGIFYVGLYPERTGCFVNGELLLRHANRLPELLPDDGRFAAALRIVDLPPGYQLLADIVSQEVACLRENAPEGATA